MNDMLNNLGFLLSIGASFVAIMGALVSCVQFLRRQGMQRVRTVTRSETTQEIYYPRPRDLGYHFGCLLKTVIIVALIIAVATVIFYLAMGVIALSLD